MFSENLKEQTAAAHQSLEKVIVRRIKAVRSPADYSSLLALFYGYYQPLEEVLDAFLTDGIVPNYSRRRKATRILHDINEIAGGAGVLTCCSDLPAIAAVSDALGVLYVLEGSVLGGAVIARMLMQQAAIAPAQLTFFTGYGNENMPMWREFIASVNLYAGNNSSSIIDAAKQTFEKFEEWERRFYTTHAPGRSRSN